RGLISDEPAVAQRLEIQFLEGLAWIPNMVHLAAQPFEIVDDAGVALPVEIGPDTLLWRRRERERWRTVEPSTEPYHRIFALPVPQAVDRRLRRPVPLHAGETLFRDGDAVEVLGAIVRTADPATPPWARET